MQPRSAAQLLITVASLGAWVTPALAQMDSGYQTREEREIFSTSPGGDSGAIADASDAALRECQQGPKEAVALP